MLEPSSRRARVPPDVPGIPPAVPGPSQMCQKSPQDASGHPRWCLGPLPDVLGIPPRYFWTPRCAWEPPRFWGGGGIWGIPTTTRCHHGLGRAGDPQDVSPGGHIPAPGGRGELPPPFPSRNHPAAIPCRMRTPGGMKGWQGGGRGQCPRSQLATAATSKASGAVTAAGVPRGGFEGPFMGAIRIYSPSRALGGGQRPP